MPLGELSRVIRMCSLKSFIFVIHRNGSASKTCNSQILFGEILFLLCPLQVFVSMYLEERFPVTLLLKLSNVTPDLWYYLPLKICFAVVGFWPAMWFFVTASSILLWMVYFYGCGSTCLDGMFSHLRASVISSKKAHRTTTVCHRSAVVLIFSELRSSTLRISEICSHIEGVPDPRISSAFR